MKVGLYGGTFDPIHLAHLIIAQYTKEELGLDRVVFIPCSNPPHKKEYSPSAARLKMVTAAISDLEGFEASEIELNRPGISYSYQTVKELADEFPLSQNKLFWIVGADSFRDMPRWKDPEKIAEKSTVVVFPRYDCPAPDLHGWKGEVIYLDNAPIIEISSQYIRSLVRQKRSIKFWVAPPVQEIIQNQGLYV